MILRGVPGPGRAEGPQRREDHEEPKTIVARIETTTEGHGEGRPRHRAQRCTGRETHREEKKIPVVTDVIRGRIK